jgi:hypothetical protein
MANEFVTRTGLIVSGSTFLPAATSANKGYILSFDDSTKEVYYMSTSSVTVTVPGSDTQVIYNNGGAFGAASGLVYSGSNVGIGITSPSQKLDVLSGINVQAVDNSDLPFINFSNNGAAYNWGRVGGLLEGGGDGTLYFQTKTGGGLTEKMRITSAGNVGIGTTNPSARLQISGSSGNAINVSRTGGYASLYGSNDLVFETDSVFYFGVYTPRLFSVNGNFYVSAGGLTSIGKGSANATLDVSGSVLISGSLTVSGSSTFTNIGPAVFTGSITQNASTASFGGLVGIGTTTPAFTLDVNGAGRFNDIRLNDGRSLSSTSGGTPYVVLSPNSGNITLNAYDNTKGINVQLGAGNVIMSVTGSNVGIGTTNPAAILHTSTTNAGNSTGALLANPNQSGTADSVSLNFGLGRTVDSYLFNIPAIKFGKDQQWTGTASTIDGYLSFSTLTDESIIERMRLTSTGHMILKSTTSGGGTQGDFYVIENGGLVIDSSEGATQRYIEFTTGGTQKMLITAAGNVGIGVSNPSNKLEVNGGVTATSFTGSFSGSVSAPGSTTQIVYNSGGALAADSGFVYSGSRVGIGTTSPSYNLHVVGEIYASSNLFGNVVYSNTYRDQSGGLIALQDDGGNVAINKSSANATLDVSGSVLISGSLTVSGSSTFTNIGPAVFTGSITQNASTASFGGLVGIGTTSPARLLHVLAATGIDAYARIEGGLGGYGGFLELMSNSVGSNTDSAGRLDFYMSSTNRIATIDAQRTAAGANYGTLVLSTANNATTPTERMRITSGGNIGIGTNNPLAKLQVSSGRAYFFSGDNYSIGLAQTAAQGNYMYLGTATDGTFYISETSGTARVTVQQGGNVGIGTTSPSELLDVQKAGTVAVRVYNTSSTADAYFDAKNSTGNAFFGINATGQYLYTSNNIPTLFYNSGSERMRISAAGNVGIGTITPTTPLRVQGGAAMTGGWNKNTTLAATYPVLIFNSNDTKWAGIGYDYSEGLRLWVNASSDDVNTVTPQFNILNNGNVGIGTTSPASKLHVSGASATIRVDDTAAGNPGFEIMSGGSTQASLISNTSTGNTTLLVPAGSLTLRAAVGNVFITGSTFQTGSGTITGDLTVGGTITAQKLNVQQITSSVVYSSGSNIFGNNLANTQTFTGSIQATGSTHYLLGNVGIGTTSPQTLLTLNGPNVSYAGQLQIAAPDFAQITFYSSSAVTPGVSNRKASIIYNAANNTFEVANQITNGHLILQGSDSGGGNVGIGTDSPSTKLDVRGTIFSSGSFGNRGVEDAYRIKFYDNGGIANDAGIGLDGSAGLEEMWFNSLNGFYWATGTNGEKMRITQGGNVGIGTTNPTAKLDVSAGTNLNLGVQQLSLDNFSNDGIGITFSRTSSDDDLAALGVVESDKLGLFSRSGIIFATSGSSTYSATSEVMRIAENGNVGIGTTSPNSKLDISVTPSAAWMNLINGNETAFRLTTYNNGTNNGSSTYAFKHGLYYNSTENAAVTFYRGDSSVGGFLTFTTNDGTERMRITNTGNIGIGTTSPSNTLQVAGGVTATSFTGSFSGSISAPGSTTQVVYNSGGALAASSNFVFSGSNVGIGTSSPAFKLDVNGDSATRGTEYILQSVNNTTGYLYFDHSGTQVWKQGIFNDNTSTFSIGNGGGFDRLFNITNAGNVGIGTTSPESKLQIGQSFSSTSGTNKLITINAGGYYSISSGTQYNVMGFSPTTIDTSDIYTQTTGESVKNFYLGVVSENAYFNSNRFSIFQGGAERLTIQGYGASVGNVGIGTTAPNATLQVANTTSGNAFSMIGSNSKEFVSIAYLGYLRSRASDTNGANMHFADNGNTKRMEMGVTTTSMDWYSDALASTFLTFQHSTGNIGIGTSSPTQRLHVSGAIAIEAESTTTKYSTTFSGSLTGNTNIAFVPTGSFKAAFFDYYVASGSTNMRAGTIMAVQNNSTSRYTDTSTGDIGSTSAVDFSTSVLGGNLVLTANISSGTWEIKTSYRAL